MQYLFIVILFACVMIIYCINLHVSGSLKVDLGLGQEDCQPAEIDEILCIMVAGCALGTDGRHWMFENKSQHGSRFPFK